MKLRIRNLFKDFAIYGTGDILLKATVLITMPIYTRIFTLQEYGIWSFVITVIGLLNGILILGGDSAYARFFFEAKSLREKQLLTTTWFGFLTLWSGGMILLCLPFTMFFSQWSFGTNKYGTLFILALLTAPVSLINTMCGQVLRNQFRSQLFITLNIFSTLLSVGLSLFAAVILDLGLIGVLGGALMGTVIILPIRLWTARTMLNLMFSFRVLRNMLAFGVPLVPTSLAYWVFAGSDRLVIGKLSTLDELGLYTVAITAASLLGLVNGALGQAWSPHAIKIYEGQPNEAPVFFGRVMTYILVGFGLLSVCITTFAREVLMVLSTPAFYPAAIAMGPLALGFMAYASTQVTATGISITKKTKYFASFSWMAAVMNLILNILLVPKWGMIAASWTTAASYTFLTIAYFMTSQRLYPVVYEKWRVLAVVGLTFGFVLLVPFLPEMTLITSMIVKIMYCLIYVGLLFVLRILDKREWEALTLLLPKRNAVSDAGDKQVCPETQNGFTTRNS